MSAAAAAISYRVLTPKLAGKAVQCVKKSFGQDPFSRSLDLSAQHWSGMSGMFIERAAEKKPGLSLVAYHEEKKEVVGLIINEDWKDRQPPAYRVLPKEWAPVRAIFNVLHLRFKAAHPQAIEHGTVLHPLYFSCVQPEYRRQGILTTLLEESISIARDFHYEFLVCESSHQSVASVCRALGFREKASVSFDSFMFEGKNVFYDIAQEDAMADRLSIHERRISSDLFV
eukprot:TRINITY_DN1760_c1_g1_i1.p1 TRINITY_DN1760_c1_g1~~TRINITY_DN1760_c1_g1_i1.p1  ORF type:complete len:228 (-),score=76.37 TRINITY_DN1760_c1_g1_i1:159-842(-)